MTARSRWTLREGLKDGAADQETFEELQGTLDLLDFDDEEREEFRASLDTDAERKLFDELQAATDSWNEHLQAQGWVR